MRPRIELCCRLDQPHYVVACSGGIDSTFAAIFLRTYKPKVGITLAYYSHPNDAQAEFSYGDVIELAVALDVPIITNHDCYIEDSDPQMVEGGGIETQWRDLRYSWLDSLSLGPVIVGHQLNDVAETYLMSAMHGQPKLIPVYRNNVIRPFLMTPRTDIEAWMEHSPYQHFSEDPTNADVTFTARNRIRHNILPEVLKINPGFLTMIRHKLRERYDLQMDNTSSVSQMD